ncbi:hypothetical protein [Thalassococcus sp. S3]|uniref:hypothetical protein n=1 Tax=Thalassococcus sp. S3 TaxID=2017482 RepID=UPI0010246510|nr:hypothetical protein [Thalassococcus sp. S3]QBF32438.1 hypothetical protein CFI11_14615 [Thalassococcus sp. S3]
MTRLTAYLTALALALGSLLSDAASAEENPRTGLMWNRTGLPAVFPLQVKSPPGRNYYLTLRDPDTDAPALAAFIEGGRFFRVLVPPGTFTLRFASGATWLGEDVLFGPGDRTHIFDLAEPLTFEVRGVAVKSGHIVDLTNMAPDTMAMAPVTPQRICQTFRSDIPAYQLSFEAGGEDRIFRHLRGTETVTWTDRLPLRRDPLERLQDPLDNPLVLRRSDLRARPC